MDKENIRMFDLFAAHAVAGIAANQRFGGTWSTADCAALAYNIAHEMMKLHNQNEQKLCANGWSEQKGVNDECS